MRPIVYAKGRLWEINIHPDALGVVWLLVNMFKICARVSIRRYFTRAFVTNSGFNVPRKGDRGTQP